MPFYSAAGTDLVQLGEDYRLTHSIWIASMTCLFYDTLLTLDDERKYIWGRKLTRARWLFWLNRYWAIVNSIICNTLLDWHNPTDELCQFLFKWFGYTAIVSHFTIGAILVLRLYAMYERNNMILGILSTLLGIELLAELILITFISSQFTVLHLPSMFPGCMPSHIVEYAWTYWIPMTVFESGLFLLAAGKAIQYLLSDGHTPTLALILVRDSMISYGGVLVLILINLIIWNAERPSLFAVFPSSVASFHSIFGCRILLNMQRAYHKQTYNTTLSHFMGTHSIQFALPSSQCHELSLTDTVDQDDDKEPPTIYDHEQNFP